MQLARATIATILSGLTALLSACDAAEPGGCDAGDWEEGLTVDIVAEDGRPFPDGRYELAVNLDGLDVVWKVVILRGELYCTGVGCAEDMSRSRRAGPA